MNKNDKSITRLLKLKMKTENINKKIENMIKCYNSIQVALNKTVY